LGLLGDGGRVRNDRNLDTILDWRQYLVFQPYFLWESTLVGVISITSGSIWACLN
jgi:hypothetical protein